MDQLHFCVFWQFQVNFKKEASIKLQVLLFSGTVEHTLGL